MTSNLKYIKNYTELGEPYQLVLPLSLEGLVPEDESVRLLSHELEELDYSLLYHAYSAKANKYTFVWKSLLGSGKKDDHMRNAQWETSKIQGYFPDLSVHRARVPLNHPI